MADRNLRWRGSRVARAKPLAAFLVVVSVALLVVPAAIGEVVQQGGVRVQLEGAFSPTALPRQGDAPIGVSVGAKIKPVEATDLPQLTRITIALNRAGHLDPRATPVCRLGLIDPSNTTEALAACRKSLVGEGTFSADVKIPSQSPFPSEGKVLAFNGRLMGQPAIFAHVYGTDPVPTSYVLPFLVKPGKDQFGTILEASLPRVTGSWGYVTAISLRLDRGIAGKSLLSAGCPAPDGFPSALFPLVRTTLSFGSGLNLTSTVTRSCQAKE